MSFKDNTLNSDEQCMERAHLLLPGGSVSLIWRKGLCGVLNTAEAVPGCWIQRVHKHKLTLGVADRQKLCTLVATGQTPIAGLDSRITNLSELLRLIVSQCPPL